MGAIGCGSRVNARGGRGIGRPPVAIQHGHRLRSGEGGRHRRGGKKGWWGEEGGAGAGDPTARARAAALASLAHHELTELLG